MSSRKIRKLLVVSGVPHYLHEGQTWAPEHFVAELDLWARLFPQIRMRTRVEEGPPPPGSSAYAAENIQLAHMPGPRSPDLFDRWASLVTIPGILRDLWDDLAWCDAAHVRAPTRWALLALVLRKMRPVPLYAKYANTWLSDKQRGASAVQKWLLRRLASPALVTTYGRTARDPAYVRSTFTSSLSERQLRALTTEARGRSFPEENRLLWVGRFDPMKAPHALVEGVQEAQSQGLKCSLDLVGDGTLRPAVEAQVRRAGLQDLVRFHGRLDWNEGIEMMKDATALLLPSVSGEGCPKVLMEAMATGLPCIATDIGFVPEVLGHGTRGLLVPVGESRQLAGAIRTLCTNEQRWAELSHTALAWVRDFSIERIVDQYRRWLEAAWECSLPSVWPEGVAPKDAATGGGQRLPGRFSALPDKHTQES